MSRVSDLASSTRTLATLFRQQQLLHKYETQVGTGRRSQDYAGIYRDSQRLVNLETQTTQLDNYISNNKITKTRLKVASAAVTSIDKTISDFRELLLDFRSSGKSEEEVAEIQKQAFQALAAIQDFLNTQADGMYLFSGSAFDTEPVDLKLGTLAEFQKRYDGATRTYPDSADAHLASFSVSNDGRNEGRRFTTDANYLVFRQDDDRDATNGGRSSIEATSDLFSGLAAGSQITISNTAHNNGVYTIDEVSPDGTKIYLKTEMLTDETAGAASGHTVTLADDTVLDADDTGDLTFSRSGNTITAATAGAFSKAAVGQVVTVANSTDNDGVYTIKSISPDGTTITVENTKLTDEGTSSTTFFDFPSFTEVVYTDNAGTGSDTIQVRGAGGGGLDVFSKFKVGQTVSFAGSTDSGNDQTYTITGISADGSTITVAEGLSSGSNPDTASITIAGGANTGFRYTTQTNLEFSGGNRITVHDNANNTVDGSFDSLRVGQTISIAGSTSNDGEYLISAIDPDGGYIEVTDTNGNPVTLTAESGVAATTLQVFATNGTITADGNYYQGDTDHVTYRVDDDRSFEFGITAIDPAFEKAIRALGIIAQGKYGAEGGLDQNPERVTKALALLASARSGVVTESVGDEDTGNTRALAAEIGRNQVLVEETDKRNKSLASFFKKNIDDIENVDKEEAITSLLQASRQLEASFQAIARVQATSLVNYL